MSLTTCLFLVSYLEVLGGGGSGQRHVIDGQRHGEPAGDGNLPRPGGVLRRHVKLQLRLVPLQAARHNVSRIGNLTQARDTVRQHTNIHNIRTGSKSRRTFERSKLVFIFFFYKRA